MHLNKHKCMLGTRFRKTPPRTADTHCIRPIMVHERMVTSIHFILLHIYRFTLSRYDKRSWSDQRMAEIKALLGLKNQGNVIAHGLYDPYKM